MFRPCLDSKAGLIALCAVMVVASGCSLIGGSRSEKAPPPVATVPATPVETDAAVVETSPLPDESGVSAEILPPAPAETVAAPSETTPPSDTPSSDTPPVESTAPSVAAIAPAAPQDSASQDDKKAKNDNNKDKKSDKKRDSRQAKDSKKKGKDAPDAAPVIPPQAVQAFNDAVAQLNAGGVAQAEQAFRALGTQYPQYAGPLVNLGIIYAKSERFEEAATTLQEALRRSPANPIAFNELGIVYRRLGRFEDADAAYMQALRIDPNYALAHLNLGVLCDLYLQQPERALQAFERYLAVAAQPSPQVNGWVSELKTRLAASQRSAEAKE